MASAKLVLGGAATAAVGVRVARSLYGRWRVLPDADRRSLETLAEDLKTRALELRGALDADRARSELRSASEGFAAALVRTARADPELDETEVQRLRADLRRELDRLESGAPGSIKASRSRRGSDVTPE
jgi:hypothetical protein